MRNEPNDLIEFNLTTDSTEVDEAMVSIEADYVLGYKGNNGNEIEQHSDSDLQDEGRCKRVN